MNDNDIFGCQGSGFGCGWCHSGCFGLVFVGLILLHVEVFAVLSVHGVHSVGVFLGDSGATTLGSERVFVAFYLGLSVEYCIHQLFRIAFRRGFNAHFVRNILQFSHILG